MRILLINDFVDGSGGAERYNQRLKKLLEAHGHQVELFGSKRNDENEIISYFTSWYNLGKKREIAYVLDGFGPDVVHCHNIYSVLSPSIFSEIKKRKIPLCMKIGDLRLFCPKAYLSLTNKDSLQNRCSLRLAIRAAKKSPGLKKKIHPLLYMIKSKFLRSLINKYVDVIICPSHYTAKWAQAYLDRQVRVIPNFINLPGRQHVRKANPKRILYVGRLGEEKGIRTLVAAFGQVGRDDVELHFVGDGPLRTWIESQSLKSIYCRGFIDEKNEIDRHYQKAHVTVLPSLEYENSPLTIIESMANGTPVITTSIGGQKELVSDGEVGYLVDPGCPSDLAQKILTLIEDEQLRNKMSRNALKFARQFSPEVHLANMESLFQSLVEAGP